MYFVYGTDQYLIDKKVKDISANLEGSIKAFNDEHSLELIFNEIANISFIDNKKIIIVKNHKIFTNETDFIDEFINLIKNINDVELIFSFLGRPKTTLKFISFLLEEAIIEKNNYIESRQLPYLIKNFVNEAGGTITNDSITFLINNLPNDLSIVFNEIEKLMEINKNISKELVASSLSKYSSNDIFAFSKVISSNNGIEIISEYINQIQNGIDRLFLISQISSLYILACKINIYKKTNYKDFEFQHKLKVHPYRLQKAMDVLKFYGGKKINNIIMKLSQLEYQIKVGKIDKESAIDIFILNLIK